MIPLSLTNAVCPLHTMSLARLSFYGPLCTVTKGVVAPAAVVGTITVCCSMAHKTMSASDAPTPSSDNA